MKVTAPARPRGPGGRRLSKISIQTGTSHGGVPLPDGSIARVQSTSTPRIALEDRARGLWIGRRGAARGIDASGRAVRSLPATRRVRDPSRHRVPELLFDHPAFPPALKHEIYQKLRVTEAWSASPRIPTSSSSTRPARRPRGLEARAVGIAAETRAAIGQTLERKFAFLLEKLEVTGTRSLAEQHAPFVPGSFPVPLRRRGRGGPRPRTSRACRTDGEDAMYAAHHPRAVSRAG